MLSALLAIALGQIDVYDEGTFAGRARNKLDCIGAGVACVVDAGAVVVSVAGGAGGGSGGAPTDATYITQTANATLTSEQALSSLSTGLVSNTTGTGVLSIYGGSSCSANTVARSTSAAGALTCSAVVAADISGAVSAAGALAADPSDCSAGQYATTIAASGNLTCAQVAYSQLSGTPTIPTDISGAGYWTKTSEASLSNEFAMGGLTSGLVLNTTTTGVPTIYTGTSCTNQFPRSLNASGAATCASVVAADISGAVNSATALASDPADCSGSNFALGINASGTAQCAQPAFSNLSGSATIAQGGTTETASAEDAVLVGSGTTDWQPRVLPSCSNGTTSKLLYNSSTNEFSCGTDQTSGGGAQTATTTGDHTLASTTGTEVTELQISIAGAGLYVAEYFLLLQSAATGTGIKLGVNYTGSLTSLTCNFIYPSTGTTAASGVMDDTAAVLTGSLVEAMATNAASTTAPNLGPNTGVAAANANILGRVYCIVVTGGAGDLELWHGSEGAVNTSVKANSVVRVSSF